ncbi:hypothetical protein KBY82_15525 [Cyanobium sp. AMD-g]|uniref:hypothetical protein n=1 Tax=Cyanobium sp. AMD-g TaxID=2823699 RepID=UPI0020CE3163|nr:hypothetical protein [Cyanobium sp. AMD-g]MCP9932191.1 hypothetical protein [Cyanobium sp. AMD-g]
MLPTLAERLREQQAKTRGRRPSRPPWPVPGEPPTALLFLARPGMESTAVPVASAMSEPGRLVPVIGVTVTQIASPELEAPLPMEPSRPVPERTTLVELLLLLVWAVLVVIDGALALISLINGAVGRQRRPQARTMSVPSPSAAPSFLVAVAAP